MWIRSDVWAEINDKVDRLIERGTEIKKQRDELLNILIKMQPRCECDPGIQKEVDALFARYTKEGEIEQ